VDVMTSSDHFETVERRGMRIEPTAPLAGNLVVPDGARGVVLVVGDPEHDAILGRAARDLQEAGLATLLLDLLTPDEERRQLDRERVPGDPCRLGERAAEACRSLAAADATSRLDRGILAFGRSAPGALRAAAADAGRVRAVVTVDGWFSAPAVPWERVEAATLLLVLDDALLPASEAALRTLAGEKDLRVVRSGRRALEESLERVLAAAVPWLARHLAVRLRAGPRRPRRAAP
jgi:putative phosphoribosyl transferase